MNEELKPCPFCGKKLDRRGESEEEKRKREEAMLGEYYKERMEDHSSITDEQMDRWDEFVRYEWDEDRRKEQLRKEQLRKARKFLRAAANSASVTESKEL